MLKCKRDTLVRATKLRVAAGEGTAEEIVSKFINLTDIEKEEILEYFQ